MADNELSTFTDLELFKELASRHDKFIAIKPERKDPRFLKVFCNTHCEVGINAPYELYTALDMLSDAAKGIIRDCFDNKQNFIEDDYGGPGNPDDGDNPDDTSEDWKLK